MSNINRAIDTLCSYWGYAISQRSSAVLFHLELILYWFKTQRNKFIGLTEECFLTRNLKVNNGECCSGTRNSLCLARGSLAT